MKKKIEPKITNSELTPDSFKIYGLIKKMIPYTELITNEEGIEEEVEKEREEWEIIEDSNGVFKMKTVTPKIEVMFANFNSRISANKGLIDFDRFTNLWSSVYCGTEKDIPFNFMNLILQYHISTSILKDSDRFFLKLT